MKYVGNIDFGCRTADGSKLGYSKGATYKAEVSTKVTTPVSSSDERASALMHDSTRLSGAAVAVAAAGKRVTWRPHEMADANEDSRAIQHTQRQRNQHS